ncbi:MAG TPA: hypothetical protein VLC09_21690, partial [Polyangiaceae bacterium]|nr:hypothetical protein [Polyangiaceae bacterium]
ALLRAPQPEQRWTGLRPLHIPEPATPNRPLEGRLLGGNLTVLFAEAAAGRLALDPSTILVLEDVSETSYRVDRMLVALAQGGHLRSVQAVVLGDFTDCSPGKFDVPVEQTLLDCLRPLGVTVFDGLPIGHGARNRPLLHGAWAKLHTEADGTGTLEVGLPGRPC